jgi:dienelactone hydrolase/predicted Ser/Thr protein kinase
MNPEPGDGRLDETRPFKVLSPGTMISHYKIIEKIGAGGMGVVYKALDTRLDRPVALKFLPPRLLCDAEAKARFEHEAKAASALNHNNITTIHEIDEAEGRCFIVMEYIEGQSIRELLKERPLAIDEIADIALQIGSGLDAAHKKGIIHRDIKSANIMWTDTGQAKIMDFGLAKVKTVTRLTREGTTLGTVAYMSPEQARGEEVDHRSDIWSLGVVLYEMLSGELPFKGDREAAILYSVVHEEPKPLKETRPGVPPELVKIIDRALKKKAESRYPSVAEMLTDLTKYRESLRAEEFGVFNLRSFFRLMRRPCIAVPAALVMIAACLVAVWLSKRQKRIRWAKEEGLPEIERFVRSYDFVNAYGLAQQAEQYIPNHPKLVELLSQCSMNMSIHTTPPGARIYTKEYSIPESDWEYLGISPIEQIRLPLGFFRWKIEKEGYETVMAAWSTFEYSLTESRFVPRDIAIVMDEKGTVPSGMVRVDGGRSAAGELGDFFIDKHEVTNRQFKEFIDEGGYQAGKYWKYRFIKDGKEMAWEETMAEFRDATGRPGPASWQAGDYPNGRDDYPVAGISWYEAAAYAEFAGKDLPTIHHWRMATGLDVGLNPIVFHSYLVPLSNFGGEGPAPVGRHGGVTSYGAYDMAGNVREWCWNETQKGRCIRGGAWNDAIYMLGNVTHASPFDRSPKNGFRCVRYIDTVPDEASELHRVQETRDFYKGKPVSDAVFEVYKGQFSYDQTDLNARIEMRDESAEDWIKERITFDAAYGDEHIIAYLYLPRNASPPLQAVVYFPGSSAEWKSSSQNLEEHFDFVQNLEAIVKNGRAVLYPVYKGTYERRDTDPGGSYLDTETHQYTEFLIKLVKDFRRSVDYLETRSDIDGEKLAYCGYSWGGVMGNIIPAVDGRVKASVLVLGGLPPWKSRPGADEINYVARVKIPTLMLNGKYDFTLPLETYVKPMYELLGTPDQHKVLKVYETDHFIPRNEVIKETLAWLDRYLGPVK